MKYIVDQTLCTKAVGREFCPGCMRIIERTKHICHEIEDED